MCRWVSYFGNPIQLDELLYKPPRSLVEQSRASSDEHLANADGFGLGWYGHLPEPGVFHSVAPAWSDPNLRELCGQVTSHLFIAHVRAATGTPVQQTNCHPFRHGRWIFVHNGFIAGYERLRRELVLAIDPSLFWDVRGTTDSEVMFHLALTFGLDDEPLPALERMAGFIEAAGRRLGIDEPLQMTLGVSNGERLYGVRYASGPVANTLYVSSTVSDLRQLYPEREQRLHFSEESRAVVSEPLFDLPGLWHEVPAGSALIVQEGPDEAVPFAPRPPSGPTT
jgi:predicted glutamine amidotransferase